LGNRLEPLGTLKSLDPRLRGDDGDKASAIRPDRPISILKRIIAMTYAIIGFGSIGQALARAFARNDIEVTVASRRPPEALLPQAQAIGPKVIPRTLQEAVKADVIILAVLFEGHQEVGKMLPDWKGKTIIDAMNTNDPVEALDNLPSSAFAARSFPGARFVKGFNHLLSRTLATDPKVQAAIGWCSCRATTKLPPRWWPRLPNSSASRPSISASSTRVARWCRRARTRAGDR
jgi:hypothetical protein